MQSTDKPIALFCADLHLSLNPPLARSLESDWFMAMKRHLDVLKVMQRKFKCPILCAGDIFDRWNAPVELVNFAIENLPTMFAVPGQHDLPMHSYEEIKRTAYWTLVSAGIIANIDPKKPSCTQDLSIFGAPWGFDIPKIQNGVRGTKILVSHRYIWASKNNCYPGAEPAANIASLPPQTKDFDLAIFGDNHIGFTSSFGKTLCYNCGGFFIRKADEQDYTPSIGVLYTTGEVERIPLDISKDKVEWKVELDETDQSKVDTKKLIEELNKIGDSSIDFVSVVERLIRENLLDPKDSEAKKMVLKAIETKEQTK